MISRSKDRKIPLGVFGKPFGLKGFIFLRYYGGNPENIKEFKDLFVKESTSIEVEEVLIRKGKLTIKLKGVDDRNEAEKFRDEEVFVFEDQLPVLPKSEHYWFQLEKLQVINEQNEILGAIDYLMPTGANDVMAIKPFKGSIDDKERLVPFLKKEIVVKVDLGNNLVYVKWPKDY